MYYGLIILSVIMFGLGFVANDSYQKREGDNIIAALRFSLISSVAGALILFCTNGFVFECTPFTLVMGIINAVSSILLTYCGFKALGRINLSLYSLFMMLGGIIGRYAFIFQRRTQVKRRWNYGSRCRRSREQSCELYTRHCAYAR